MAKDGATADATRILRRTLIACVVGAVLCMLAAGALGRPVTGVLLGVGLLIGAANAHLAKRLLTIGLPFGATSLLRLSAVSGAALVLGLFVGFDRVWLIVLGIGVAQLVVASNALVETTRR